MNEPGFTLGSSISDKRAARSRKGYGSTSGNKTLKGITPGALEPEKWFPGSGRRKPPRG
jgi:hypothetical protein